MPQYFYMHLRAVRIFWQILRAVLMIGNVEIEAQLWYYQERPIKEYGYEVK